MKNTLKGILAVLICLVFVAKSQAQSTNFSGNYRLTSLATSFCLDGDAQRLYPHKPNGGKFQNWKIEATSVVIDNHRAYTLTSSATNKCLDGNATNVYPKDKNGGNYQKWLIIPSDMDGYFIIKSLSTSKVLDGNATTLYPSDFNNGSYQKWKIEKL